MQGKIIKGIAGFYYVYGEDEVLYECKAKGIFRKDNQKPLVGDNVEITVLDEQEREGNLTRILPRKNSLIRPAVANVDQAFVIFAMENPKPNFMLLDRFLIMMEQADIPAVICFNKRILQQKKKHRNFIRHTEAVDIRYFLPVRWKKKESMRSTGSSKAKQRSWQDLPVSANLL